MEKKGSGGGRILFVDDEPSILSAYSRELRRQFDVATAEGPEKGLASIAEEGPYAVVVSDLRMPGMDGIEFLARVRELAPDAVRVMLTGQADMDATVAAVNEGNIFRFLTKPVQHDTLVTALEASLGQYRLITAERELLEKTLSGSIKVLTDVLSLSNPIAFSRASRLRRYVRHVAERLDLAEAWQFEMAATLAQIGCVTLFPDTLEKIAVGQALSDAEQKTYDALPSVGQHLLANIPRLEAVAEMIGKQREPATSFDCPGDPKGRDIVALGAQMLKAMLEFDELITKGVSAKKALSRLQQEPGEYDPAIVAALENVAIVPERMRLRAVKVDELAVPMIINQEVRAKDGRLLVAKGQEVTLPSLIRLRAWSAEVGIVEPIRVLVPHQERGKRDAREA